MNDEARKESAKEPLKTGHDLVLDEQGRILQRRDDWQPANLLMRSVIENWHESKLGLHVHFGTRLDVAYLKPGDYCARYDPPTEAFLASQADRSAHRQIQSRSLKSRRRGRQGFVLVPIVDYRYMPEQLGFRPLPAVVRLQPLHCCAYAACNARHAPLGPGELPPSVHQGELDISLLRFRLWSREQEHQVVEGGSEVVGGISNEYAQDGGHGLSLGDLDDEPAFTLLLKPKGIELRLQERMGRIV